MDRVAFLINLCYYKAIMKKKSRKTLYQCLWYYDDPQLKAELDQAASEDGRSVSQEISALLRRALRNRKRSLKARKGDPDE